MNVHSDALRTAEVRGCRRASVTAAAARPAAGDRVDASRGHRLPVEGGGACSQYIDTVVARVTDDQIVLRVDRHPAWVVEGRNRVDVAHGHRLPIEHRRARGHDADAVVGRIGDYEVAVAVE